MMAAPKSEFAISSSIHVCQLQNPHDARIACRVSRSVTCS